MNIDSIKFKRSSIVSKLYREQKKNMYETMRYLTSKMKASTELDLDKVTWVDTKNYKYCYIKHNEIDMIIRYYNSGNNFIVYTYTEKDLFNRMNIFDFTFDGRLKYNILSEDVKNGLIESFDEEIEFIEMNSILPVIFQILTDEDAHSISYNDIVKQYKYLNNSDIDVLISEEIYNIDMFILALEELYHLHFMIFAEDDLIGKLKTYKVGEQFGNRVIKNIHLGELDNKEPYYHSVGLELTDKDGKSKLEDIYTLLRYYHRDLFGKKSYNTIKTFQVTLDNNMTIQYTYKKYLFCVREHVINGKTVYSNCDDAELVLKAMLVDINDDSVEILITKLEIQ